MRPALRILAWTTLLGTGSSMACSCYGPQTFCGVLHPPFPNPEWWVPDAVVLGVKVGGIAHGMDVKVLTVFSGTAHVDDTLRVWGDTGLLCRVYADTWGLGDTVVWALRWTDYQGGPLEEEGDYLISVCGTYWLDYANGMVTGALTEEGVNASIPIEYFADFVSGCLATGVNESEQEDRLLNWEGEDGPWLSLTTMQRSHLTITDAMGRSCLARDWDGSPLQLTGMAAGVYVVLVRTEQRQFERKIMLH
ncbi:MAG: hypothetical protein ABI432_00235 [Flavobacteriales bacterium]